MEQANWYAVYTAFRAEKRVKERLDQAGIKNYLPLRVVECKWGDRVKRIEVPLVCGCVFVFVSKTDFIKVVSTSGVVSFLGDSGSPAIIPDRQIECLCVINDNADEIEMVEMDLLLRLLHV